MTTSTLHSMIAVAALAVAASSASAQTFKAEVPMAFQVAGKTLSPGSYEVRATGLAITNYVVSSRKDGNAVVLIGGNPTDVPKAWRDEGSPRMTFECLDGHCSLKSLWTGQDATVQTFRSPNAPAGDVVAHRLQVVTLTMVKAH